MGSGTIQDRRDSWDWEGSDFLPPDPGPASEQLQPGGLCVNRQVLAGLSAFKMAHVVGEQLRLEEVPSYIRRKSTPRAPEPHSRHHPLHAPVSHRGTTTGTKWGNVGSNRAQHRSTLLVGLQQIVAVLTSENPSNTWKHLSYHPTPLISKVSIPKVSNDYIFRPFYTEICRCSFQKSLSRTSQKYSAENNRHPFLWAGPYISTTKSQRGTALQEDRCRQRKCGVLLQRWGFLVPGYARGSHICSSYFIRLTASDSFSP